MKKLLFLLPICALTVIAAGCGDGKEILPNKQEHIVDDPPSAYVCVLNELFNGSDASGGERYCKVTSVEFIRNEEESRTSGYFIAVGLDTDLSEEELTCEYNNAFLATTDYVSGFENAAWDSDNSRLVMELQYMENADYSALLNLQAKRGDDLQTIYDSDNYLTLEFNVFSGNRFVKDGTQYGGVIFRINLE